MVVRCNLRLQRRKAEPNNAANMAITKKNAQKRTKAAGIVATAHLIMKITMLIKDMSKFVTITCCSAVALEPVWNEE